ncbi:hypothetical protein HAX54_027129 [Datura stramonium]|uniref:Uncharacterized protein n=1 Tax=Datura stramonium TaxID=4076 RepID=A0ABS8V2W6_DATST|nr:hypothetical protein [Datura stramonium]
MNRRLNLDTPEQYIFVTTRYIGSRRSFDWAEIWNGCMTLDILKNKRIRSVDLLQDQFGLALVRLENVVRGLYEINVGLIGSLAIHADWSLGISRSPFYEISERSTGVRMLYLSPGRDRYYGSGRKFLAPNQDIQEEQFLFLAPKCIVGTGLERQAALDSGALAIARREGRVVYANTDKILLLRRFQWTYVLHSNPLEEEPNRGTAGSTWYYDHWGTIPNPEDAPESFRLLVRELRSLALELNHFLVSEKNFQINRKEA